MVKDCICSIYDFLRDACLQRFYLFDSRTEGSKKVRIHDT